MLKPQNRLLKLCNGSLSNLKIGNWTIKPKLQGLLLTVSLGSVLVVSGIGWYQAQSTLRTKISDQLSGIRTTKADQFELYFENLNNQVGMPASDRNVVKAMVEQLLQRFLPQIRENFGIGLYFYPALPRGEGCSFFLTLCVPSAIADFVATILKS